MTSTDRDTLLKLATEVKVPNPERAKEVRKAISQIALVLPFLADSMVTINASAVSANTTLTSRDSIILVSGGYTITLPASPDAPVLYWIRNKDSSLSSTIARNGNNLEGAASDITLNVGESIIVVYADSTGWWVL